jgi:hypothetical protein
MQPWVYYLLALMAIALAQTFMGSRKVVVLSLVAAVAVAEALHVFAGWSGSRVSVVAAVLGLVVLLPWAAAAAVIAWRPSKWRNGAAALLSVGSYVTALLIGVVVGDMSGWIPQ